MAEVIGVRFKDVGKVYYFDPDGVKLNKGARVIVETARGIECGIVAMENREVDDDTIVKPLKKLVRIANEQDLETVEKNRAKEREALAVCQEKIQKYNLEMKLIDVEYTFDCGKILFYFTADGRVDFRELVKDLASVFRTRIELRQIGVRDESKMLGGLGICGKPFCCSTFLGEFQPVSIKMAKEQGLSLNPTKISGTCGRLMCCLKYEQPAYEELSRITPRQGNIVKTPDGNGTVTEANLISGNMKVHLGDDGPPRAFHRDEVVFLAKNRNAWNEMDATAKASAERRKPRGLRVPKTPPIAETTPSFDEAIAKLEVGENKPAQQGDAAQKPRGQSGRRNRGRGRRGRGGNRQGANKPKPQQSKPEGGQ